MGRGGKREICPKKKNKGLKNLETRNEVQDSKDEKNDTKKKGIVGPTRPFEKKKGRSKNEKQGQFQREVIQRQALTQRTNLSRGVGVKAPDLLTANPEERTPQWEKVKPG